MTRETFKEYIWTHLRAVMPVSPTSVLYWTQQQFNCEYDVADILMELVQEKKITINLAVDMSLSGVTKICTDVDFYME
jgi:ABC-type uncharacterized transport system involved in gliding motility auxiliary subunit